jgi:hypothetical protein
MGMPERYKNIYADFLSEVLIFQFVGQLFRRRNTGFGAPKLRLKQKVRLFASRQRSRSTLSRCFRVRPCFSSNSGRDNPDSCHPSIEENHWRPGSRRTSSVAHRKGRAGDTLRRFWFSIGSRPGTDHSMRTQWGESNAPEVRRRPRCAGQGRQNTNRHRRRRPAPTARREAGAIRARWPAVGKAAPPWPNETRTVK